MYKPRRLSQSQHLWVEEGRRKKSHQAKARLLEQVAIGKHNTTSYTTERRTERWCHCPQGPGQPCPRAQLPPAIGEDAGGGGVPASHLLTLIFRGIYVSSHLYTFTC